MAAWHALEPAAVVAALKTDADLGLDREEVRRRVAAHGVNALPEPKRPSPLLLFARQLASPLTWLLLAAGVIALAIGEVGDAAVIVFVVLLNGALGAFQEGRAERALTALRNMAGAAARVVRAGREEGVEARELVPGDVVLLAAGDAVPADARLTEVASLQIAEAALTGESVPVAKGTEACSVDALLADRTSLVHAGTLVTAGRGRAVVVATGLGTEIGRIASLAERGKPPPTPLERRVARLGRALSGIAIATFGVIVALGVARGFGFADVVMVGVSQLVGMVPEGLPVAMTIALAVSVQRMARRGAIVRRISAVETLGSTSVVCTDKTGTLTRNEMTVTTIVIPQTGRSISVSGAGYQPEGAFVVQEGTLDAPRDAALREILEGAVLCSDADLLPPEGDRSWRASGDPTEAALVVAAVKAGIDVAELRARRRRRAELPFDAATKMMASELLEGGEPVVIVKGAPEEVLALCGLARAAGGGTTAMTDTLREHVRSQAHEMASRALRVLAVAVVEGGVIDVARGFAPLRGRAVLLGLVGEMDPPRPGVREAIARCRAAGMRVVMVTGDHAATGMAIARDLGFANDRSLAIDGSALEALDADALDGRLGDVAVFARVQPAQKLRIIEAYRRRGDVVAMTGDGVNDAPALAMADVGVAMGRTGTEVAKQAAKIVLTDDDFSTIVAAVEEGRVAYRNIGKAILLLIATGAAEVAVLLTAMLLGFPPPFAAVQILWNNLVTEGVVTVNLVMDPAEGDEMQHPPMRPSATFLSAETVLRMALMTPTIAACTLGWFLFRSAVGVPLAVVQTETFTLLAVCEWFNVLNCRSATRSALRFDIIGNRWLLGGLVAGNLLQALVVFAPPMNRMLHTAPIDLPIVFALGAVGSLVLWVEEARKLAVRAMRSRGARRRPRAGTPPRVPAR